MAEDYSPSKACESLGKRLKQTRTNAGLTQEKLSELSELSVKVIRSAENGKVSLANLAVIFKALSLDHELDKLL